MPHVDEKTLLQLHPQTDRLVLVKLKQERGRAISRLFASAASGLRTPMNAPTARRNGKAADRGDWDHQNATWPGTSKPNISRHQLLADDFCIWAPATIANTSLVAHPTPPAPPPPLSLTIAFPASTASAGVPFVR